MINLLDVAAGDALVHPPVGVVGAAQPADRLARAFVAAHTADYEAFALDLATNRLRPTPEFCRIFGVEP